MGYPKWVTQGTPETYKITLNAPEMVPDKSLDIWLEELYAAVDEFASSIRLAHFQYGGFNSCGVGHEVYQECWDCGYGIEVDTGNSIGFWGWYEVPLSEAQIEANKARYTKEREAAKKATQKRKDDRKKQLAKTVKANKKQILEILQEMDHE